MKRIDSQPDPISEADRLACIELSKTLKVMSTADPATRLEYALANIVPTPQGVAESMLAEALAQRLSRATI